LRQSPNSYPRSPFGPHGGASATGLTNLLHEVALPQLTDTACDLSTPGKSTSPELTARKFNSYHLLPDGGTVLSRLSDNQIAVKAPATGELFGGPVTRFRSNSSDKNGASLQPSVAQVLFGTALPKRRCALPLPDSPPPGTPPGNSAACIARPHRPPANTPFAKVRGVAPTSARSGGGAAGF
jgi:hypothetical protein